MQWATGQSDSAVNSELCRLRAAPAMQPALSQVLPQQPVKGDARWRALAAVAAHELNDPPALQQLLHSPGRPVGQRRSTPRPALPLAHSARSRSLMMAGRYGQAQGGVA